MSQPLNRTPRADRIRIVIVGRRNAGKSSLINAIARQDVALVSPVAGTTTDPVFRSMEIHGLGPVVLVDTPGLDDVGELGQARVERTRRALRGADVVVLAIDGSTGADPHDDAIERELLADLRSTERRFVIVVTKADLPAARDAADVGNAIAHGEQPPILAVSAATGAGIAELIKVLAAVGQQARANSDAPIVGDLLQPGDVCVLVTPIDAEAPAGRMILPQVQVLRDILDAHAIAVFSQPEQLPQTMAGLAAPPRLVITDSQVFGPVAAQLPPDQPLTSFSMLFARHKGDLDALAAGAAAIDRLRPGDPVLIAEACTHHPVGDDIGRVKIPSWLRRKVGGDLALAWTAGDSFPPNLSRFKLIIHCGGCMISRREMLTRVAEAQTAGVPIVNYGVLIAHLHGIMPRALWPLRTSP
jgi:[FeFe] hydrogenase H-cluster maturation GTPase HydF